MARGGYTFREVKGMSALELRFLYHYQTKMEKEKMDSLVSVLGVYWDLEEYNKRHSGGNTNNDSKSLFIPLSVAINPQVLEYVKAEANKIGKVSSVAGGEYKPAQGEQIKSMADMDKDEFLKMVGRYKKKS